MEKKSMGLTSEYQIKKLKFSEAMDKNASFDTKLELLNELADEISDNMSNSQDFGNNILNWVKIKDSKLYEAYQVSLKEIFAEAA